ncbi:MAG: type IV pilus secretin PilQ [Geobacteraceae bacterium]|nr:type IV pilus secretin PilQ [Geobacteraceae bacterium]
MQSVEDGVEVTVPGGVATFNSFRLSQPPRLVLDLHGIKSGVSAATIPLNSFGINKARLGVSPDKVRIVLDTVQNTLPPYQIVKTENGLKILFKGTVPAAPVQTAAAAVMEPVKQQAAAASPAKPGPSSVEAIEFKAAGEYSQISIKVTGDCRAEKPVKVATGWALTIKNCQLPRRLQRMLDTAAFASPVREITPYQVKARDGYDTKLLVKLRTEEPFNFKQEGNVVYWNIRNPETRQAAAPLPVEVKAAPAPASDVAQKAKNASSLEKEVVPEKQPAITQLPEQKHGYTGRKVTLEFSDADVRKIFQLIAEVSNLNFLISDDVSGNISLKLVNVPWDQALDVILESKSLEKRQEGNILYIKPKGKFRTVEQEESAAREERERRMEPKTRIFNVSFAAIGDVSGQFEKLKSKNPGAAISPDARTNRVIVTDIEDRLDKMGNLLKELDLPEKQVMIEARIVEATSTFTRDLGVQWGIHYQDGAASFLGINDLDTGFGGIVSQAPSSGTSGPGGAIGMSFGKLTSNIQIDLRLSAAATAGLVKIISTPKVVTLNNKAAKISQGQSIPYLSLSAEGTRTEFVEAALTLEVTPHITADGSIGMKIKASNNSPGTGDPPSINKKEATTELQVMNGETTVIGGIYVDSDTESNTGVPFLMDIPLLGWLFKSNSKNKVKTELLIFITPRIVS